MPELPKGPYPWIRVWGWFMGSHEYYIKDQIARAIETKAPAGAIYERYDAEGKTGVWSTVQEIANPNTRYVLEREYGPLPEA